MVCNHEIFIDYDMSNSLFDRGDFNLTKSSIVSNPNTLYVDAVIDFLPTRFDVTVLIVNKLDALG